MPLHTVVRGCTVLGQGCTGRHKGGAVVRGRAQARTVPYCAVQWYTVAYHGVPLHTVVRTGTQLAKWFKVKQYCLRLNHFGGNLV